MADYFFPTWKGWLLINPMRLLFQNPTAILGPYVTPGAHVLDLGCSMGYFALPLARMVGPEGRVLCLDSDDRQLNVLRRRARRKKLIDRLEVRRVDPSASDLGLEPAGLDFAAVLQVLHYMDDPQSALEQVRAAMKPGAVALIGEPKSHLSDRDWDATVDRVVQAGFGIGPGKTMYNLRFLEANA